MKQEVEMSIKGAHFLAGKIQECSKQLTEIKQGISQLRSVSNTTFKNTIK